MVYRHLFRAFSGRVASALGGALLALCASAAAPLAQGTSAPAGPGDPFTVSGIEEDVTAETAQAAREKAVADGQRRAFDVLVERLAPPGSANRLPRLSATDLDNLMLDYEVDEEHASSVRYVGRLSYRFKPMAVKALFENAGIGMAETQSLPVVVVPVLQTAGGAQLWDDPNPWRDAWAKIASINGLVPLIMPVGDIEDVGLITPEKALAEDPKSLSDLAQHYNAGGVLIAAANPGPAGVEVRARLIQNGAGRIIFEGNVPASAGADPLDAAARQTESALEDSWKSQSQPEANAAVPSPYGPTNETGAAETGAYGAGAYGTGVVGTNGIGTGQGGSLSVEVPLSSLADWIEIRKRLADVPLISHIGVTALTRNEALVDLGYAGDPQQLALALSQHALTLVQSGTGWTLHRSDMTPQ